MKTMALDDQRLKTILSYQPYLCERCNEMLPASALVDPLKSACPKCGSICIPERIIELKAKDERITELERNKKLLENRVKDLCTGPSTYQLRQEVAELQQQLAEAKELLRFYGGGEMTQASLIYELTAYFPAYLVHTLEKHLSEDDLVILLRELRLLCRCNNEMLREKLEKDCSS